MQRRLLYSAVLVAVILIVAGAGYLLVHSGKNENNRHYQIGIVTLTEVDSMTIKGFKEKLAELGFPEGERVTYHFNGPVMNMEQNFAAHADMLRQKQLDLIFVSSTPASVAVKKEFGTSGIPIIFSPVSDPLAAGLVESLRQPGGNITGVKLVSGEEQRLRWLKEVVPHVKTVFVPYTVGDLSALATIEQITPVAEQLGLELKVVGYEESTDTHQLMLNIPEGSQAVFIPRDSRMESRIESFVAYCNANNLPLSAPSFLQAEKGALFSYGHVHYELG
ncbi:MAG: ABC transporter substrate-binding protein, partial [Sulfurimonadaceae bacterium]|nr:ABC transporter substrate-binding protein [Sulfurimonadaceae bacterium]